MLIIIKYLSYNKNKSKKNYIKCTKFKVAINFITNSYLLGIEKVLNFILIPKGQVKQSAIPEGVLNFIQIPKGQEVRGTAIPQVRQVMVMEKDRDPK
jgi:predicted nucleotidyltransferase